MATTYIITDALDSLETALVALVSAETIRHVVRRIVNPTTETNVPIIGIVPVNGIREGGPDGSRNWRITIELALVGRLGSDDADIEVNRLIAEVDAVLEAWEAAGTSGCTVDAYRWDPWYHSQVKNPLSPVGAVFSLDMRIEGPLKKVT